MDAKYFPALFKSRYPCLSDKDWIRRIEQEDLRVFVDIGCQAHEHGRKGGQAILAKRGREYLSSIGRIGAISANSKRQWIKTLLDEQEKLEQENKMDTQERIDELQEMRQEFILNESVYADDHPSWGEVAEATGIAEDKWNETDEGKELKALEDNSVDVIFRKFPEGDVIAFISGYPCNAGMIISYQHIGQHGEASIDLINELELCTELEYKALLQELESLGYYVTVDTSHDESDDYGYAEQKNFD